ncbi:MAG TPA: NAD(P)-dependent oxidoreductase, partial [Burkholderiaceae bacterium]|nr:NAD(P)-dependent oxidoreductase [Burkholderiaceae bacterium]
LADLADKAAVEALVAGIDAIVHLGAVSTEQPWEPILAANIVGTYHLYEAARKHGVKRIVFASSNHVTGFYRQDEVIDARAPMRPDGLYGLSKAFGENLAQLYWDRYRLETVSLRIGSSFEEPRNRRMLATWLSFDDLERLVVASLSAPVVGHTVVYGVSDNAATWWDNRHARHLGYRPRDSSERFRAALESRQRVLDPKDPAVVHQGGSYVKPGPHD